VEQGNPFSVAAAGKGAHHVACLEQHDRRIVVVRRGSGTCVLRGARRGPAEFRWNRAVPITGPGGSFTATFLVVDVRGWSRIVHSLGPDPTPAGEIIKRFWDSADPVMRESGGEVYAWRGDGLLVAYQGPRRTERAFAAATRLLAIVRGELAPGLRSRLPEAGGSTLHFAVAAAITDGRAVSVPVRFAAHQSDELTGDAVNAAFDLVKWADAGTVGITWDVSCWLAQNSPASLRAFSWLGPKEVLLAGAFRRVLQGLPASDASNPPSTDPPPGG